MGTRSRPELGHAVYYQTAAFVFFLFAQDHILAQGHVIIGLAIGGTGQFQVAAFHRRVIGRGVRTAHRNGGVLCIHCLQLGHVHGVRIQRTCGHAGNLTGHLAVVAYGNGVVRSFPGRASRSTFCIGRFFFVFGECTVLGTGSHRPFAQGDRIIQRSRCTANSQRVLPTGRGAHTECCRSFAGSNAVFTPDSSIGIAQDMIAVGTGISLSQRYVRKRLIADGHLTVTANGSTADIAPIVADIGIAVFSLEQHVAVGFPAGNGVGDGFGTAVVRIGQISPGIHLFTEKFVGIAVLIFNDAATLRIRLIDYIRISTVVIQHCTGYVIGTKGYGVHACSHGTVAESGGIFT